MRWLPVFVISLLMVAALVPCLSVGAQPRLVPLADPATAQSTLDPYSFLIQYAELFALMSAQDFANASRLGEELSHITVPADLTYIVNRYNSLTQQLINVLSDLQSTLNNASSLLDQYRLDEAGQALDHAGVQVAQAQILLGDLQDATSVLSQSFGVLATPAASKVRQAYDELQRMLQELNDLINRYHTLLTEANERAQEIKSEKLASTTLSLALNTTKCFVGGYVSASGVLSSKGQGLQNRAVEVLLDGSQVATANTQADGSYNVTIKIPYKYVNSVSVSALYTPAGNDQGVYLPSSSPTVKLQVLFYHTALNVSVSSVAYPGLSLSIKGNVTSEAGVPLDGRQVRVLLDGAVMARVMTNQSGVFSAKFTINSGAKLGAHTLTISVDSSGLYAGASVQRTLTINKMASFVKVNVPSFVVLPSKLHVSGAVRSASGPLKGATVLIELANISANVTTLSDGSFNLTLDMPSSVLAGYQDLSVRAQPSEPWQATAQTKASVFVLNSVSIGLALATSLSVVFVTYTRFIKSKGKKVQGTVQASAVSTLLERGVGVVVSSNPELKLEGSKGAVLKAYIEALGRVELATGDSLMPSMTLREFMQQTGARIGKAADPFYKLTMLAERSLYSSHEPETGDLETAKDLAGEIGRILSGESA